jgi:vacuolar-type H+-ATPase subunit F/Vma7
MPYGRAWSLSRVLALLGRDLGAGFALSGIEVTTVADAGSLRGALEAAVVSRAYGLVVVEEEMMRALGDEARMEYAAMNVPLIVEVPGSLEWQEQERAADDSYVASLIRRAVGYQLSIKV